MLDYVPGGLGGVVCVCCVLLTSLVCKFMQLVLKLAAGEK
jgi:hypothetical protein